MPPFGLSPLLATLARGAKAPRRSFRPVFRQQFSARPSHMDIWKRWPERAAAPPSWDLHPLLGACKPQVSPRTQARRGQDCQSCPAAGWCLRSCRQSAVMAHLAARLPCARNVPGTSVYRGRKNPPLYTMRSRGRLLGLSAHIFQIFFHSPEPMLYAFAYTGFFYTLGSCDFGLALAEYVVGLDPPALRFG